MKKSKVIFLALLACAFGASARTVTQDEAARAARLWAIRGTRLGTRIGGLVRDVKEYQTNSLPAFYAIEFSNGGTVFTSANTDSEPILAYAKDATAKLDKDSPLAAMLYKHTAGHALSPAMQQKWTKMLSSRTVRLSFSTSSYLGSSEILIESIGEIDDVRVSPFVKTKWAQGEAYTNKSENAAVKCYDYYTPTDSVVRQYMDGKVTTNVESTVCGCVATAMAQAMKYWSYPQGEREAFKVECSWPTNTVLREYETNRWNASQTTVRTNLTTATGAYDWANMTDQPLAYYKKDGVYQWFGTPVTNENCQAIGKLTYDCGVAVGMEYGISDTGGSGILTSEAGRIPAALKEKFSYTNALLNQSKGPLSSTAVSPARQQTILANLDAGCPVMLLITGNGGHAVVADGYGYSGDEKDAYVHLNMGWAGQCDVWYNLPLINTSDNPEHFSGFDTINSVVYNVFPTNVGEIVSGHVTTNDAAGVAHAISNLVVTATDDFGNVYETTTSKYGVYAFIVPAGRSYRIYTTLGEKIGEAFTGVISASDGDGVGNSWGNDIKVDYPTARIGDTPYVSLDRALDEVTDGDVVEILRPSELKRTMAITNDCMIVATNDNPAASAVTCLDNSRIEIADSAAVAISNVAFNVEYETTVVVSTGGVLRVGGYCGLGTVCAKTNCNLVVDSELTHAFAVDCACAAGLNMTFALGADDLDYLTASNCANKLLHSTKTRWGGEAYTNSGKVFFRWSNAAVPDEAAVAKLVVDGQSRNYRAIDDILEDIAGATGTNEIAVVKNYAFASNYMVRANCHLFLHGFGNVRPVLKPGGESGFVVGDGGSLTISNLVFSGYRDADTTNQVGFICVKGGELTLESGAELNDMVGEARYRSGVVDVLAGTLTMRSGSAILGCTAAGGGSGKGKGGAIYAFATNTCLLNLEGGTISNCHATVYGGGIYVDENESKYVGYSQSATVKLSGDVAIVDNTSDSNSSGNVKDDDLCIANVRALPRVQVVGNLSKRVGVLYSAPWNLSNKPGGATISGNDAGDAFITNMADMTDEDAFRNTLAAFFNDAHASLMATNNATGDKLVWAVDKNDPRQCEWAADASARLIAADGSVTLWREVSDALNEATDNCIVEVIAHDEFVPLSDSATVHGTNVMLRTDSGVSVTNKLLRGEDVQIVVPVGSELILTNLDVYGCCPEEEKSVSTKTLFDVNGGTLRVCDAAVYYVFGDGDRNANAITVCNGGVLKMSGFAEVSGCENLTEDPSGVKVVNAGAGGGILVDNATAYFRDMYVDQCLATWGGGVFACNGSRVYMSGCSCVYGNCTPDYANNSNLQLSDDSKLVLDGEMTGYVGMTLAAVSPLSPGATNLVATVGYDWTGNVASITNSAAGFERDSDGNPAVAVTNGTKALIVWYGALKDGLYVHTDGKVYAAATDISTLVPVSPVFLPLPELSATADAKAVADALDDSDLADPSVKENVKTLADYNEFREWAQNVDGGVDAVVNSTKAGVSYDFGTTELLTDDPTVEITEIGNVADGLKVSVVVKDGDDPVKVAADKVAEMFEATSDVGDWTKTVDLTVENATQNADNSISFTVVPAGNPSTTFIRLKY